MAAPSPHSDGTSRSIAHAGRRKARGSAAVGTVLRRKRKAPRSTGNPWSSPAGLRPRTARDRGAHRSAAAALGYPRFGVTAAPPECRSPLRGRHLRRAATLVFHRITPFVGRISQVAGPNPPGRRTAQVLRQPPRHARNLYISDRSISRAGCQLTRPGGSQMAVRWICPGFVRNNVTWGPGLPTPVRSAVPLSQGASTPPLRTAWTWDADLCGARIRSQSSRRSLEGGRNACFGDSYPRDAERPPGGTNRRPAS